MTEFDIIVCKGNNWLKPPYPLLYGSRNSELTQVRWRQKELEMVDLDWVQADWQLYRRQLETVRMNRNRPIKYVVLPDMEDRRKLIGVLQFGWSLKRRDIMEIAILPIKVPINLNQLPDWIRPGLPLPTGYKNKKYKMMMEMDLSSFHDYTGAIHTLGGSNLEMILQFAYDIAPKAEILSMDFSTFTWVAENGKVFVDNCIRYDHVKDINRDEAIDLSYSELLNTLGMIRRLPNHRAVTIMKRIMKNTIKEKIEYRRQTSLEAMF